MRSTTQVGDTLLHEEKKEWERFRRRRSGIGKDVENRLRMELKRN